MNRLRRRATAGAVLALTVLGGAACAAPAAAPPAALPQQPAAVPVLLAATHLQLPLDRYLLSVPEQQRLGAARVVLLNACLRRQHRPAVLDMPRPVGPRSWNERRYGITDLATAEAYGYGLGDRDPGRLRQRPRTAVPGVCLTGVQRRLEPVPLADPLLAQRLSAESYGRSRADTRVRSVISAWSRCMRTSGYSYDDPLQPGGDPRLSGGGAAAVATATADIACKQKTNLVGVWFSVEAGYQRREIAANRPALETIRQAHARQLAAAQLVPPAR